VNNQFFINSFKKILLPLVSFCAFFSCTSNKNITYFQDLTDTAKIYSQVISGTYEIKIQPDDILEIVVNSINASAAAPFNLGNTNPAGIPGSLLTQGTTTSTSNNGTSNINQTKGGYLVDKNGNIDFPILGSIKAAGLTITELKDLLKNKLDKYLQDPILNIRLLNYKITVLGEVGRPSTYSIPSERITVVDALGMAGDLTINGKRENVLLIREEDGKRNFIRLNLNSSNLFQSPYYYLKQNDILYVEPDKAKANASDITQLRRITIVTSIITLLIVLVSRF
jgi:polysaccharide export outer membrane protein